MQYGENGSELAELKHEFKYNKVGNCICIKTLKDGEAYNAANQNCDSGNYISYCDIVYDSSGNKKTYVGYEGFSVVTFEYQFDSDGYPIKERIDSDIFGTYEKTLSMKMKI